MGRSTALRFLVEGARVVIADQNDATGKEFLEAASQGGHARNVRFVRTDVSEESDVEAMIGCAVSAFGRVDIVFNNAGIGGAIINTASVAGLFGGSGPVCYAACKAAV